MARYRLGLYTDSLSDFDKTLSINDRNESARCGKGRILIRFGNYHSAITEFTRVIDSTVMSFCGHYGRGSAHGAIGNYNRAVVDYSRALNIAFQSAEAYLARGMAYFSLGHFSKASSDLQEAIRLQPENPLGYSGAAFNAYAIGEYTTAVELLLNTLKLEDTLDVTNLIYIVLANQHSGRDRKNGIDVYINQIESNSWPQVILDYLINENGDTSKIYASLESADEKFSATRKCFVGFVLGEQYLIEGNKIQAEEHYLNCMNENAKNIIAYTLSQKRLRQL